MGIFTWLEPGLKNQLSILAKKASIGIQRHQINDFSKTPIALHGKVRTGDVCVGCS